MSTKLTGEGHEPFMLTRILKDSNAAVAILKHLLDSNQIDLFRQNFVNNLTPLLFSLYK